MVQYRHTYIHKEEILAESNLAVGWLIHQTVKFTSPNSPPIRYTDYSDDYISVTKYDYVIVKPPLLESIDVVTST